MTYCYDQGKSMVAPLHACGATSTAIPYRIVNHSTYILTPCSHSRRARKAGFHVTGHRSQCLFLLTKYFQVEFPPIGTRKERYISFYGFPFPSTISAYFSSSSLARPSCVSSQELHACGALLACLVTALPCLVNA
jgi:hypothetical protein